MRADALLLILLSVSMSAVAQLLLKTGVGRVRADGAVEAGRGFLASPWVIGGLALYGVGAFVWLYVLARVPLSVAYPFVGLGFVLTMLFGVMVLGEGWSVPRVAGTLLIALGCVCVARSAA